jgi:hypothetical protein
VAKFTTNLQKVIDSCKAAGIIPIVARVLATDPAKSGGWQIHGDYIKAVDDLTSKNSLPAGPDLFAWFKAHPGDLNPDGVHPNAAGAASIQRLWAEAVSGLYVGNRVSQAVPHSSRGSSPMLSAIARAGSLHLRASATGTAYIHGMDGRLIDKVRFLSAGTMQRPGPAGLFLVRFVTPKGSETALIPPRLSEGEIFAP